MVGNIEVDTSHGKPGPGKSLGFVSNMGDARTCVNFARKNNTLLFLTIILIFRSKSIRVGQDVSVIVVTPA